MDNLLKALMRCRNTDDEYRPEIANPHYFKMPNGQLVLYATDGHILLIVKETAGLLDKYEFEPALVPNIAAVIPTEPCRLTLNFNQLATIMRRVKIGRDGLRDIHTAVDIEGAFFHARMLDRIIELWRYLDLPADVPMAVQTSAPPVLKLETEQYIIVQAGMVNNPDVIKTILTY